MVFVLKEKMPQTVLYREGNEDCCNNFKGNVGGDLDNLKDSK